MDLAVDDQHGRLLSRGFALIVRLETKLPKSPLVVAPAKAGVQGNISGGSETEACRGKA